MDYQVVISKDPEVDVSEFAAAWNEQPDRRALAEAREENQRAVAYPIGTATLVILGSATATLVGEAVKDLLKDKIKETLKAILGWSDTKDDLIVIQQWENSDGNRGFFVQIERD